MPRLGKPKRLLTKRAPRAETFLASGVAATLAFAGVLALAGVLVGFAAALTLAGVLPLAGVLAAFRRTGCSGTARRTRGTARRGGVLVAPGSSSHHDSRNGCGEEALG